MPMQTLGLGTVPKKRAPSLGPGSLQIRAMASADEPYAAMHLRLSMKPGQMVELDGSQSQSIGLVCGADASRLAVTGPADYWAREGKQGPMFAYIRLN